MATTRPRTTWSEIGTDRADAAEHEGLRARVATMAARQRAAEGRLVSLLGPGACPPVAVPADGGEWWDADLGSLFALALALRRDLAVLRQMRVASLA